MEDLDSIREKLKNRVDAILQKLNKCGDIQNIWAETTDLILEHLKLVENSLGYWEKMYFAYAINALGWNINSSHKPPLDSWLRLCLISLEYAFVPPEHRAAKMPSMESQIESLSFEQLYEAINEIRTRLL